MSAEIVLLSILTPTFVLILAILGYFVYQYKQSRDKVIEKIVNKVTKNKTSSKEQKEMDTRVMNEVTDFIKESVPINLFPDTLPEVLQNNSKMPSWLAAVAKALIPSVVTAAQTGQVELSLSQILANPELISGALKAFSSMRQKAKENYKRPIPTPTATVTTDNKNENKKVDGLY